MCSFLSISVLVLFLEMVTKVKDPNSVAWRDVRSSVVTKSLVLNKGYNNK